MDFSGVVLKSEFEASQQQKQLYAVTTAVQGLIGFIVASFEELGIERLHQMVDPSLVEIINLLGELRHEAFQLQGCPENLTQAILLAESMVQDIKRKNADLCVNNAKILKTVNVS